VNHDAIEAVIDKGQQIPAQLGEPFHSRPRLAARKPTVGRRTVQRGTGKQGVEGKGCRRADEVRYIQGKAADHDGRIVAMGQLVLFSTETEEA
jgi:hypothetical protein